MVAKAAIDRRGAGKGGNENCILTLRTAGNPVDPKVYEPWDMSPRERELALKYIQLIQGCISTKDIKQNEPSPLDETLDMGASLLTASSHSSNHE